MSKTTNLEIRRVYALGDEIVEFYLQKNKGFEEGWRKRSLIIKKPNGKFFVGYAENNLPVCFCAVDFTGGVGRVDDVYTDINNCRRGYGGSLIQYDSNCGAGNCELIYLDTDNSVAKRIYFKTGFRYIPIPLSFMVAYIVKPLENQHENKR